MQEAGGVRQSVFVKSLHFEEGERAMKEKLRGLWMRFRGKLLLTAVVLAVLAVGSALGFGCPILNVLGVPCPGCGMTRALLNALRLDFSAAFAYHPMFWSVPVLYGYFLTDGRLLKHRLLNALTAAVIGAGFAVQWICRLAAM